MNDEIHILGLEMPVRIGVPEEERTTWQVVSTDIRLTLKRGFDEMDDELSSTVDYQQAANEATALAAERPRKLIEVLASDLVKHFLARDTITAVDVTVRKRILPHTDCVAVRMQRRK